MNDNYQYYLGTAKKTKIIIEEGKCKEEKNNKWASLGYF